MDRLYVLPMEIGANGKRGPKYLTTEPYKSLDWGGLDYGSEDTGLYGIRGINQVDHDALVANADVIGIPEDLQANMTAGQVTAAVNFYDTLNIPSDWINTSRTVLQVVKITAGLFQFNQRWRGQSATRQSSPFKEGLNLDTQYNQLSEIDQARVLMVYESMAIDYSGLTGTSTIRDALREFAIQISARPLFIAGMRFD